MNLHRLSLMFMVAVLLLVGLTSISTAQVSLQGRWDGSWESCRTGHRGRLSASFCRIDDHHVQANFRGTFAKVIPFRYRPVLDIVHEEPGLMIIQGSKRLPLMGNFEYQAVVTGNDFQATYRSRRDHGVWSMRR